MTRDDVYKLIDGEREYQESLPLHADKVQQANTPIAAWLLYIEEHLQQAKNGIYILNETVALEQVRKITALGVACMEHNETLPRKITP